MTVFSRPSPTPFRPTVSRPSALNEKKSYHADLEHRRWRWFLSGLVGSTALFAALLMLPLSPPDSEWEDVQVAEEMLHDIELLPLRQQQQTLIASAPEEPKAAERLRLVDQEVEEQPEDQLPPPALETDVNEEEYTAEEEPPTEALPPQPELPDEVAQFPGGPGALARWLTEHLKYPPKAQQWKQQGRVVISFVVNVDGTLTNVSLAQSATTLLDREALRVVAAMPPWTPGSLAGKPCRSVVQIPIIFRL